MSQSYATARLYRKNYLKRKRGQQVEDRRGGSIILQDTPIINANFILSGCLDIGDPVYTCLYCGASFWLLERVEKQSRINQPLFTLCCFQGKIQLPYLQKAPDLLYNLIHGHDSKSLQF
nr:uncharacterized protein LOC112696727 isoform X4 [Arachis hypogaea]